MTDLMRVLEAVREHGSVESAAEALGTDATTLRANWRLLKRRRIGRIAQAKYRKTAKGQATATRYNHTQKRSLTNAKYRKTAHGQQTVAGLNAKRVWIGRSYQGRATTVAQASAIKDHIRERTREFKQGFAHRKKAEGVPSGEVSPQAAI